MLELSPPLPILLLLRVAGLSGLNTIIVKLFITTVVRTSDLISVYHRVVEWLVSDEFIRMWKEVVNILPRNFSG
jgi:hypothetical protein